MEAADGSGVVDIGTVRIYDGRIIPYIGNSVEVAYDSHRGGIWVGWPLEPVVEFFSFSGGVHKELQLPLSFQPPPPVEFMTGTSPIPNFEVQTLIYDVKTDDSGKLYILISKELAHGRSDEPGYRAPELGLMIVDPDSRSGCVVDVRTDLREIGIESNYRILMWNGFSSQMSRMFVEC